MDQINKIRTKNALESLLGYCYKAKTDEEKIVLLRICIVAINKLRIHSGIDTMLGCDVRELNRKAESCTTANFLTLWLEGVDLVQAYKEALSS